MSVQKAKDVIDIEIQGLRELSKRIGQDFQKAVKLMAGCEGRVAITGMGKTGLIGRKIAATLSSTGTPSIFLHSAEAVHGDLGQVTANDVLLVISKSGETEETMRLLPQIKKIGVKVIAMTGSLRSSLAKYSDVVLDVGVRKEGCPLELAPMASTTATLVMGDALAAALIVRKGFRKEDFAFYHPGGALGKKLLLKVSDIMRVGKNYARVRPAMSVKDALLAITKARCGSACVIDSKGKLVGIFTDGDLRRQLDKDGTDILSRPVKDVMTKTPSTIGQDHLAAEALKILKDRHIDEIPVINESGKSVGILDIQDLLKAGLV